MLRRLTTTQSWRKYQVLMVCLFTLCSTSFTLAYAALTGGIFNMKMTDAVITIINGKFGRGVKQLFRAWRKRGG